MAVPSATVIQYYTGILRETPTNATVALYSQVANTQTLINLLEGAATTEVNPIIRVYQAAFNRVPDSAGLTGWVQLFVDGPNGTSAQGTWTLAQIAAGFVGAPEFTTTYGPNPLANNASAGAFISALYNNVLNRVPAQAEVQAWLNVVAAQQAQGLSNSAIATNLVLGFSQSPEFIQSSVPAIQNFQNSSALGTQTYSGTLWSQGVGATYTLTTNPDVVGTEFNEVNGVIVGAGAAGSTLQIFDTINMGSGIDTANFTGVVGAGPVAPVISAATTPILAGVEVLNYRATSESVGNNLAGSIAPNLTTLNYVSPLADVTFANVPTAVTTLGLSNVATNGVDATYIYAAGLLGATDAATLSLTNNASATNAAGTYARVTVDGATGGLEILNVAATGDNTLRSVTVTANAVNNLTTLNITGSGSVAVEDAITFAVATGAPVINASTNTGGVFLITSAAGNLSFTGGAGDDTIAVDVANFTVSDTINGGTGSNTLCIYGANSGANLLVNATTTALNAAIAGSTNMQNILLAGGAGGTNVTLAANVLTQTSYTFASTGDVTVTAISGDTMTLQENGTAGAVSFTGSLGATALTLNLDAGNGTAAGATTTATSGFNTVALNVNTDSTPNATTALGTWTIDNNTAVTATGNAAFTTVFAVAAGTIGAVYNGSAVTGIQNITGTGASDSITGGSNNDSLVGGIGNDTIVGGAGNDAITGGAGADTINGGDGIDNLTMAAGDTLLSAAALADGIQLTSAYLATLTRAWDIDTISVGDTLTFTGNAGTGALINGGTVAVSTGNVFAAEGFKYWNDGTNTYVLSNSGVAREVGDANTEMLIIVGVHTLGLTAGANSVLTVLS